MKIKKVDDKPMVIHTKQKAKIDSFGKGMREAGQMNIPVLMSMLSGD